MRIDAGGRSGFGAPTAPEWRWALPRIAALFIATRLLLIAIAAIVETTQSPPTAGLRWSDAPILASFTVYDSRYYLGIAASGYHAGPVFGPYVDYVFFPLFPILARVASLFTLGDVDLAGVLVANAAFGGALVTLYALSIRHLTRDAAMWSLAFLALAPGAVAFGLAYTDSLFLLLAAGAFLAAETRRPAAMGILLALAALTRPPGILLAIPLFVLLLQDPVMRARRAWIWLVLGPLAIAGFSIFVGSLTGDLLGWLHAQSIWSQPAYILIGHPGATPPPGWTAPLASPERIALSYAAFALWFGSVLFSMFLFVFFRPDRMPAAYWLVALLPFASMAAAGRFLSATRFLAVAWPFDWVLALRRSRWVRVVVPIVFVALQAASAWLAFTWKIHP
ncbi:MAG: hypothetical protein MUE82_12270 [Chloroflexi bacterium]|jgi:hypothetical protein|nr:hypothetical protein [Chloroflexota bacterium]